MAMKKIEAVLNNDQKERLISLVREYPCLYKHDTKDNKDNLMKENAWIEIIQELFGDDCCQEKKMQEKGNINKF